MMRDAPPPTAGAGRTHNDLMAAKARSFKGAVVELYAAALQHLKPAKQTIASAAERAEQRGEQLVVTASLRSLLGLEGRPLLLLRRAGAEAAQPLACRTPPAHNARLQRL